MRKINKKIFVLSLSVFILATGGKVSSALADHVILKGQQAVDDWNVNNNPDRAQVNFTFDGSPFGASGPIGYIQQRDPFPSGPFVPAQSRDIEIEKWTTRDGTVQEKIRMNASGVPVVLARIDPDLGNIVFATSEDGEASTQAMKPEPCDPSDPSVPCLQSTTDPVLFIFFHQSLLANNSTLLTCNGAYPEFCPAGHHMSVSLSFQSYKGISEDAVDHFLDAMRIDPNTDPCTLNIQAVNHVLCIGHGFIRIELID